MRRIPLRGLLAAALLAPAAAPAEAQAEFPAERACGPGDFRCARVTVPLDHDGAMGGRLRLAVRRLPAAAPATTAFVVLVGGPGQASTPLAGELSRAVGAVRGPRDLVLYDERGVGASGELRCRAATARGCALELGRRRGAYTTVADVADLEAIRVAGGYERFVLYGTSYGTKVALEYAAAHPDRVERLVLDSVVAPEGPDPLQLSTFAAVRRALPALCAAGACHHPVAALARIARRLDRRPAIVRVPTGGGGIARVRVDDRALIDVLLAGDRNPVIRAETPGAILAADHGDLAPLGRLVARGSGRRGVAWQSRAVNPTRNVTTICEELPFPWRRAAGPIARLRQARARLAAVPQAQLAPFDRDTALTGGLVPLCLGWPTASAEPPASVTLPQGLPALLLAGDQDLRTPLEDARAVASRLGAGATLVEVPGVGHSVLGADVSGCAEAALAAFMADAPVAPCGDPEALDVPRPPARTLAAVPPYRGVPGRAGRTLAATSRTVADARRAALSAQLEGAGRRVAGLRGGTATRTRSGLLLRRYAYVPGVELSGLLPNAGDRPLRMTVGGRAATPGRFTVANGRIRGRLGGRRIDVAANPPAARAATLPHPRLARVR